MCDIYVFYDSIITANISLDGHDFHNKIKIWHLRLWYISEKGLIELDNQDLLCSEKLSKLEFWYYCIPNKWHQV